MQLFFSLFIKMLICRQNTLPSSKMCNVPSSWCLCSLTSSPIICIKAGMTNESFVSPIVQQLENLDSKCVESCVDMKAHSARYYSLITNYLEGHYWKSSDLPTYFDEK